MLITGDILIATVKHFQFLIQIVQNAIIQPVQARRLIAGERKNGTCSRIKAEGKLPSHCSNHHRKDLRTANLDYPWNGR